MISKQIRLKYIQFISLILLVLIAFSCALALENVDLSAYADTDENVVFFEQQKVEANANGLVYVELSAEGVAGTQVKVTYHTESISAIPGIDYENITNTVTIKIAGSGKTIYKILLKL